MTLADDLPDGVVVFGASGFIGRNLVERLRGRIGHLVAVNASGTAVAGCAETVRVDGIESLSALPQRTIIVNLAAARYFATSVAADQASILSTNVGISDAVYRLALGRGITEIRVASSSAVYPAGWPTLDDAKPVDLNGWPHAGEAAYAWSKRWGEIVADIWHRRAGINTISLRLTNPYGPFDTIDEAEAHVATAFVIRAILGEGDFAIRGDPEAERDFVFAGDVAATFASSLRLTGRHEAVNCAFGKTVKVIDLAHAAMRAAGRERPIRMQSAGQVGAGVKVRRATAERLRVVLPDLAPYRPLEEGLRATIDWYRDALR